MQDIFNLLPNTNTADLAKAFAVQTNDMMVVVYLSALIRSVIALHNLVNNRCATYRTGQAPHDAAANAAANAAATSCTRAL